MEKRGPNFDPTQEPWPKLRFLQKVHPLVSRQPQVQSPQYLEPGEPLQLNRQLAAETDRLMRHKTPLVGWRIEGKMNFTSGQPQPKAGQPLRWTMPGLLALPGRWRGQSDGLQMARQRLFASFGFPADTQRGQQVMMGNVYF